MTDNTKTISRWMIWLSWLILIGLLTLFFDEQIELLYNPNQNVTNAADTETSEVVLIRNKNGHYLAGGLINGIKVTFIIDTGASDVSIPITIAKKLNLEKGVPVRYQTANGSVVGYRTMLDSVQIGGIKLNQIRGGINPGMSGNYILLGMTFLKQVEMIQRGNKLKLRKY